LKIFVTGSTGLLGHQVVKLALDFGHEVLASYVGTSPASGEPVELDLLDLPSIKPTITKLKPDAIIHTAAYTDVDGCETNRDAARKLNADATKQIALAANEIDAHLTYTSTDYVFDGEKGRYKENDKPHPISHYGHTKFEGELHVRANSKEWCIARTSAIYGWGGEKKNFATWLLDNLSARKQVKVVTDQYVSPTLNTNLAEMVLEISERKLTGVLHTAGASRVNRYEFAVELAKVFDQDPHLIKRAKIEEMNWPAKRPKDSSLNVSRCTKLLKAKPLGISEALKTMKAQH
jgi:dTDP-4-dehydrorhamnose reductase